jgi:hypothetical protein
MKNKMIFNQDRNLLRSLVLMVVRRTTKINNKLISWNQKKGKSEIVSDNYRKDIGNSRIIKEDFLRAKPGQ